MYMWQLKIQFNMASLEASPVEKKQSSLKSTKL